MIFPDFSSLFKFPWLENAFPFSSPEWEPCGQTHPSPDRQLLQPTVHIQPECILVGSNVFNRNAFLLEVMFCLWKCSDGNWTPSIIASLKITHFRFQNVSKINKQQKRHKVGFYIFYSSLSTFYKTVLEIIIQRKKNNIWRMMDTSVQEFFISSNFCSSSSSISFSIFGLFILFYFQGVK